jgi:tetratricopeptide (TPR) repeat protein
MTPRFRTTTLDAIGELPVVGGSLRWKPIRRTLDVRAFGINAYVADAGHDVVEEHDETGAGSGGHQEAYLVLRGRARFTVDGEEVDAPAGTIVFLPEPTARRAAQAVEDGTMVLAIGADPAAPYEVSPWEYYFPAEAAMAAGDYDAAVDTMLEGLPEHEGNPNLHYQLACALALGGRHDEAIDHLGRAYAAAPDKIRGWAAGDADLDALRERPDYPIT